MSPVGRALGPLLAGTWANTMLFTLEIILVYIYFRSYPKDTVVLRTSVLLLFLIDCVSTVGSYAGVYLYTVTHWGDTAYLRKQYWPVPTFIITTALSALIAQTFLVYRHWRLSRNFFVSVFLWSLVLTALAGSIALTVQALRFRDLVERSHVTATSTIWLITSAVADVCIALALSWQFWRLRTEFSATRTLLNRLILAAIRTGTVTSAFAITSLALYVFHRETNFAYSTAFCLGRVYALSMLVNLNARGRRDGVGMSEDSGSVPRSGNAAMRRRGRQSEAFSMTGVHVLRTVHVEDDQNQRVDTNSLAGTMATSSVDAEAQDGKATGTPEGP